MKDMIKTEIATNITSPMNARIAMDINRDIQGRILIGHSRLSSLIPEPDPMI